MRKQTLQKRLAAFLSVLTLGSACGALACIPSDTPKANAQVTFEAFTVSGEYGVGYTLTLEPIDVWVDGELADVSVALLFNGETVARTQGEGAVKYRLTQQGEYTLLYTAMKGGKYYTQTKTFTVTDTPYFSEAVESEYRLGEQVDLFAEIVYGTQREQASVRLYGPNGEIQTGDNYTLRALGDYSAVFCGELNGKTYETTEYFSVTLDSFDDLFLVNEGRATLTQNFDAPTYLEDGNGLLIKAGAGTTLRYANTVDLRAFTQHSPFIEFTPLRGGNYDELNEMIVRFVDIYDENNVVQMKFYRHSDSSLGYCAVNFNGQFIGRSNEGVGDRFGEIRNTYVSTIYDAAFGYSNRTTCRNSACGEVRADMNARICPKCNWEYSTTDGWMQGQINYNERQFYLRPRQTSTENWLILDADDPEHVGIGSEWKGFTTGEVYVELYINGAENAGIILSQLAGQSFAGDALLDSMPPSIILEYEETEMPQGVVGKPYAIPKVSKIIDVFEGELPVATATVKVCKLDGKQPIDQTAQMVNGALVPQSEGTYRIEYRAKDSAGNAALKRLTFTVVADNQEKGVACALPTKAFVGTQIELPDVQPYGVSKVLKKSVQYYYGDTLLQMQPHDILFLDKAETIRVLYDMQDYVGNRLQGMKTLTAEIDEKPILSVEGVQTTAIKGNTLFLPDFTAIDYNFAEGEENRYPTKSITVNGTALNMNTRAYTVTEEVGSTLQVRFSAGAAYVEREIKVIQPLYLPDYFQEEQGSVTRDYASTHAGFLFDDDVVLTSVNPMMVTDTSGFLVDLCIAKSNFKTFVLELVDFYDTSKSVRFVIDVKNGMLQINGKGKAFAINIQEASLTYKEVGTMLEGYNVITQYADGRAFNGFSRDLAFVKLHCLGVEKASEIRLLSVSGKSMRTDKNEDGTLETFVDTSTPSLVMQTEINFDVKIGETLVIPAAQGLTMFGGFCEARVSVYSPDWYTAVDDKRATESHEVAIDAYGYWSIEYMIYYGADGAYESVLISLEVKNDTPPKVTYDKQFPETVKVGDTITIPTLTVETVGEYTAYVAMTSPDGKIVIVQQGATVTLDKAGVWIFTVSVFDAYNAFTQVDKITVKEK